MVRGTGPASVPGLVLVGGLAASVVGGGEAVWALSRLRPAEYQAIAYAVVGYGAVGALASLPLAVLYLLVRARLSGARAVSVVAGAISSAAVAVILQTQAPEWLRGLPWPPAPTLCVLATAQALGVAWLGRHLVQKTAFRVFLQARGVGLAWVTLIGVALLLSVSPAPGASATFPVARDQGPGFERRPDVILVVVSGLGDAAVSAAPALTALAAESIRFDQAIASGRSAAPGLGALFTSLPPSRHGAEADGAPLREDLTTVAEVFQQEGYVTLGLPDDPAVTGARGFGQGFDSYRYRRADPLLAAESSTSLALYRQLRRLLHRTGGGREEAWLTPAGAQVERALELVEGSDGQRVFLFVQLREPDLPAGIAGSRAEAAASALAEVDAAVGTLRARLAALGRWDDALVVLTADHANPVDPAGLLADGVIHVPLLVKLPSAAGAGTHVPWQVRLTDLAPTLADSAGLVASTSWWGVTLFDEWFDEDVARLDLSTAPEGWETHPASRPAIAEARTPDGHLAAVRVGGRKILTATASGATRRRCLVLAEDPHEREDRWETDPVCRRSDVTDALLSGWTGVRPRAAAAGR